MQKNKSALKSLPSVEILAKSLSEKLHQSHGEKHIPRALVTSFVQREIQRFRQSILSGEIENSPTSSMTRESISQEITSRLYEFINSRIQPVINATGVIIHTNLGRSPLGPHAAEKLTDIATGYCNLEFNLTDGTRGKRAGYLETALASLLEAEAATAVNNCAAALVLILRYFCEKGKNEVIVSRGELVEIGGGFRIPDILETSGARLIEVGATNKTNLNDYKKAITSHTAMILKVHRSNYYIGGFTEEVSAVDLSNLAHSYDLPLVEDIGSGAMMSTDELAPIEHEPTPQEALRNGIDIVCFSGDKLLGGPQSGIIAGKSQYLRGIKNEPFFRAVRCDKLILTVLQECIDTYLETKSNQSPEGVPSLEFIAEDTETLKRRAKAIIDALDEKISPAFQISPHTARTGGGTMPRSSIPSIAIVISTTHLIDSSSRKISITKLAKYLRTGSPSIVGSIDDNQLFLDLRTVFPHQDKEIVKSLNHTLHDFSFLEK